MRKLRLLAAGQNRRYIAEAFNESWIREQLNGERFDLIIANDIETAPLAIELAEGKPVWLDLHEYVFYEISERGAIALLFRRLKTDLALTYIPQASTCTTVSDGVAKLYANRLATFEPRVIPNAAEYRRLSPSKPHRDQIRLLYHGICSEERGVETLISAMDLLSPRFSLTLMLVGDGATIDRLRNLTRNPRVTFIEPVPPEEIPILANSFDLFVYALQPRSLNARHALPNKFFENVQARLGQVVTPTSCMVPLINTFGLGKVCQGFSAIDLAEGLGSISSQQAEAYKTNCEKAAMSLAWENFAPRVDELVSDLLNK